MYFLICGKVALSVKQRQPRGRESQVTMHSGGELLSVLPFFYSIMLAFSSGNLSFQRWSFIR
jgi:hypothetical protein